MVGDVASVVDCDDPAPELVPAVPDSALDRAWRNAGSGAVAETEGSTNAGLGLTELGRASVVAPLEECVTPLVARPIRNPPATPSSTPPAASLQRRQARRR